MASSSRLVELSLAGTAATDVRPAADAVWLYLYGVAISDQQLAWFVRELPNVERRR